MTRGSSGVFTVALALSMLAAGCSSHQAATPQSEPSTALSSSTATSTAETTPIASLASSTSTAAEPTTSEKTSPTSAAPKTGWTPPAYGAAKDAVDAYLKVQAATNAGLENPKQADIALIEKYTADPAQSIMVGAIKDEIAHGTAWRGTPWASRVEVKEQIPNAAGYVLTDCPALSSSWMQYDITSGASIATELRTPPPPYEATVIVAEQLGVWRVLDYRLDGSRTCTR